MDKAKIIHDDIKQFYLGFGRTEEQWHEIAMNPAKFNVVWRRSLKLKGDGVPPENLRNINPLTGEIINEH
jgi:hypothetical protein